ncbi:MAG: hypothetical protein ABID84_04190 [Chloroflexota bacterium]
MDMTLLPQTVPGWWSVGLGAGFILLFLLFLGLVASGQRGGETFWDNLLLSIPFLLAAGCAILALLVGVFGIVMWRDRSVLVFLASAIGLVVLVFVAGEVVAPH